MAQRVADTIAERDIVYLRTSPLGALRRPPLAGAQPHAGRSPQVIESANVFEGKRFGVGDGALHKPSAWLHLWNP
jgi:hypothetical protein